MKDQERTIQVEPELWIRVTQMPSLKDRFGALSLGNLQITCTELGRSVHAYQWLLERKPRFNACIKKKERVQVMSLRYRKKWMCYENRQVRLFKNLGVCAWADTSSMGNVIWGWEHRMGCVWPLCLKKTTVYSGSKPLVNVTTRCHPLRKFPKSQFEPSEIAKCLE